jgi:hypothetical protein
VPRPLPTGVNTIVLRIQSSLKVTERLTTAFQQVEVVRICPLNWIPQNHDQGRVGVVFVEETRSPFIVEVDGGGLPYDRFGRCFPEQLSVRLKSENGTGRFDLCLVPGPNHLGRLFGVRKKPGLFHRTHEGVRVLIQIIV